MCVGGCVCSCVLECVCMYVKRKFKSGGGRDCDAIYLKGCVWGGGV